jgi:NAD(P)-dependent dehydrogenase (short-subunit alcohol dehydrogenase family)
MDLTNASAIVTGGAGGFGSATMRRLAQNRLHGTLAATAKQVCATGTLKGLAR